MACVLLLLLVGMTLEHHHFRYYIRGLQQSCRLAWYLDIQYEEERCIAQSATIEGGDVSPAILLGITLPLTLAGLLLLWHRNKARASAEQSPIKCREQCTLPLQQPVVATATKEVKILMSKDGSNTQATDLKVEMGSLQTNNCCPEDCYSYQIV